MNNQHQYIPQPPKLETVEEFLRLYPDFGIRVNPEDASFQVHGSHPICISIIKALLLNWCDANLLTVIPKRNQFNRFEAGIFKISTITGQPRLLCSYTADSEGEAAFRAVLLYEQKKAAGDFDLIPDEQQPKGVLIDESGQVLRAGVNGNIPGEQAIQSSLVNGSGGKIN